MITTAFDDWNSKYKKSSCCGSKVVMAVVHKDLVFYYRCLECGERCLVVEDKEGIGVKLREMLRAYLPKSESYTIVGPKEFQLRLMGIVPTDPDDDFDEASNYWGE